MDFVYPIVIAGSGWETVFNAPSQEEADAIVTSLYAAKSKRSRGKPFVFFVDKHPAGFVIPEQMMSVRVVKVPLEDSQQVIKPDPAQEAYKKKSLELVESQIAYFKSHTVKGDDWKNGSGGFARN